MFFIAHRGNTQGIVKEKENHPDYLKRALDLGFDIEVDVWFTNGQVFLGHDGPEHLVDENFFNTIDPKKAWYHAKNMEAMYYLRQKSELNCFWHQEDDCTLTSKGFIWVHPNCPVLPKGSICVLPELRKTTSGIENCGGICSDFIEQYKKQYKS